jgi:sulfur relay (sulfurtransferase) complex TusBCD TusD component (DsrE family)
MSRYLFVQSQDPFTEVRSTVQFDLAHRLVSAGHSVRLLLVQNAVMAARRGAVCDGFDALLRSGVAVDADPFSLQQRDIGSDHLKAGIGRAGPEQVIDAMLAGDKVIWN